MLKLVIALLAGVVTVAAPCKLVPMLPILLAHRLWKTGNIRRRDPPLGFVYIFRRRHGL